MRANNITLKKIISVIPFLVMIYIIFFFSGQDGETSGGLSHTISVWLVSNFSKLFNQGLTSSELAELTDFWEFFIRKAAHVTEYAVLTFTIFFPITQISMTYRRNLATEASIFALAKINKKSKYHMECTPSLNIWERLFITVPASVLCAALDELHQYFVPGRCGIITDIGIDSIGVAITTVIILIVYMIQSLLRASSIHSSRVRG